MLFTVIRQNFRSLQNFQDVIVKYDCRGTVPINDKLHVMNIATLEDLHNFVSDWIVISIFPVRQTTRILYCVSVVNKERGYLI